MKVKVEAFVIRHKRTMEIIDIQPISDMYSNVEVTYYPDVVTLDEVKEAVKGWGDLTKKDVYFNMLEGRPFTLSCEAKDAVSIGLVKVGIEAKEIDWS